jgi:hypothetical protein
MKNCNKFQKTQFGGNIDSKMAGSGKTSKASAGAQTKGGKNRFPKTAFGPKTS